MPSISLPPLVMRKILGSGQAGLWLSSRSTARGDSTIMPCAPSPPIAFCQDQVTTSSFSQGSGIANTADVASQIEIGRHTSEPQSLMRISYAVFCLKKKKKQY